MNDEVNNSTLTLWRKILLWTPGDQGRGWRYSLLCSLVLIMIWAPSLVYLKFAKPVYTSKWTLILPGTGINTSMNLENIGQASTSSVSAYGSHSVSPKVNYKTIAESQGVLNLAAKKMNMSIEEFAEPRIKLVDQTSMIFFEVKGDSPDLAEKKSYALYEALETTLVQLRADEIKRREDSVQAMLSDSQDKLKRARDRLLAYQSASGVVAVAQFNQLTSALEQIKLQLVELKAEQSRLAGEHKRLMKILNMTASQASAALMLQTDPVFQENMTHYAQADALLARLILKMGENHPEVVKARDSWQAAKKILARRVIQLIGKQEASTLTRLMLSSNTTRGELFEKLIFLDTEKQGVSGKIAMLEQQLAELVLRLNRDTKSAATLDDLTRDHQIAEAVFTSVLARIDTGRTDVYASYPLVQILTPPSLPTKPTTPNPLFVFLGAGLATSFSLFGMLILWTRKPWLRKILLSE